MFKFADIVAVLVLAVVGLAMVFKLGDIDREAASYVIFLCVMWLFYRWMLD